MELERIKITEVKDNEIILYCLKSIKNIQKKIYESNTVLEWTGGIF